MKKEIYSTIKIWNKTLKKLRMLAGFREMSMVEIMHELVNTAYEKETYKFKKED